MRLQATLHCCVHIVAALSGLFVPDASLWKGTSRTCFVRDTCAVAPRYTSLSSFHSWPLLTQFTRTFSFTGDARTRLASVEFDDSLWPIHSSFFLSVAAGLSPENVGAREHRRRVRRSFFRRRPFALTSSALTTFALTSNRCVFTAHFFRRRPAVETMHVFSLWGTVFDPKREAAEGESKQHVAFLLLQ